MKKKSIIILVLSAWWCTAAYSQPASISEATTIAENWIIENGKDQELSIQDHIELSKEEAVLAYCFKLEPKGYVIVTNDKRLEPVLAYSFENKYDMPENDNNPLEELVVQDIASKIKNIDKLEKAYLSRNSSYWQNMLDAPARSKHFEQWPPAGATITGGWLETNWKQSAPYNDLCPMDNITGNRSLAGCPAVALAMIINYQKNLNGTHFDDADDYYHNYAGRQYWIDDDHVLMDFPSFQRINEYFDSIAYKYPMYMPLDDEEKAALVFACGIAAQQVYSSEVSGTFGVDQAFDAYIRFGYGDAMLMYDSDTSFYSHLKNNMKNGIPSHLALLVDGSGGGHNVVTDGYNTDDYYHLNFGWGGAYNGWYLIPEGIPYNLTIVEGAVLDIGESHVGTKSAISDDHFKFNVYPNPSYGNINIEICSSVKQTATITLCSQSGSLITNLFKGNIDAGAQTIRFDSDQPSGIYYIVLNAGQYSLTRKLIIK